MALATEFTTSDTITWSMKYIRLCYARILLMRSDTIWDSNGLWNFRLNPFILQGSRLFSKRVILWDLRGVFFERVRVTFSITFTSAFFNGSSGSYGNFNLPTIGTAKHKWNFAMCSKVRSEKYYTLLLDMMLGYSAREKPCPSIRNKRKVGLAMAVGPPHGKRP